MRCQPRTSASPASTRCTLYRPLSGSIRCTGARSHSPRLRRRHAAEAADRERARRKAALGQRADHHIERDVVAAHDHQIGRMRGAADQRHLRVAVGIERGGQRVDLEKAVGLREAGDRAGALAGRECDRAVLACRSATPARIPCGRVRRRCAPARARSAFRAASGGRPARARITGATKAWKVKIAEVGKAGQHHDRLVADDAEAERLAGLERDAVHQDAGLAEPRDDGVRQIAGAFRGAAGEHHHVACRQAPRARLFPAPLRRRETRPWPPARRRLR